MNLIGKIPVLQEKNDLAIPALPDYNKFLASYDETFTGVEKYSALLTVSGASTSDTEQEVDTISKRCLLSDWCLSGGMYAASALRQNRLELRITRGINGPVIFVKQANLATFNQSANLSGEGNIVLEPGDVIIQEIKAETADAGSVLQCFAAITVKIFR